MRTWSNNVADVTAKFPGATFVPVNLRNLGNYTSEGDYTDNTLDGGAAGTATVPASGTYKRVLDFRPQRTTVSITLAGVAASLIEYGTTPSSPGTVAVNYRTGELEFNSGDAGKLVVAVYKHLGSVLDSPTVNQWQRELEAALAYLAAQTSIAYAARQFVPGLITTTGLLTRIYIPASTLGTLTTAFVSAYCPNLFAGPASGNTTLYITTAETATGGVAGPTLTAVIDKAAVAAALSIDVTSAKWLNVFATAAGNHQDITVGVHFA